MTETAILGRLVKAVGLKGEVKLLPAPDFWPDALTAEALDVVLDDEERRTVHVARCRPKGETFILKLDGIDTIEAAEPLIGGSLEISLDALGGAIPFHGRGLADVLGEQVEQPRRFYGARQANQRRLLVLAVLGFHGQLTYDGQRLAGMWPHQQLRVVEKAGAHVFGASQHGGTGQHTFTGTCLQTTTGTHFVTV